MNDMTSIPKRNVLIKISKHKSKEKMQRKRDAKIINPLQCKSPPES